MSGERLLDLVRCIAADEGARSLLVISQSPPPTALGKRCGQTDVSWLTDVRNGTDIDLRHQADAGLVFDQLEHMPATIAVQLLCRLRDCHCRERILLRLADGALTSRELLAAGFAPAPGPGGGRWFRYDRDRFYEPREWNTPENWAHPENFRKYRW